MTSILGVHPRSLTHSFLEKLTAVLWAALWRNQHGKEVMEMEISGQTYSLVRWTEVISPADIKEQNTAMWVILEAYSPQVEFRVDGSPREHLIAACERLWARGTQLSCIWISDPQKLWDDKHCFKSLIWG